MIEILVEFGVNVYARDQHNRKPVDYTTPSPSMKVSDSLPWLYQTDVAPAHFLLYWPHKSDRPVV